MYALLEWLKLSLRIRKSSEFDCVCDNFGSVEFGMVVGVVYACLKTVV